MAKAKKRSPGRAGDPVSLAPLTPEQALAGLLKVKPEDVAKLEAENKSPRPKAAGVRDRAKRAE